MSSGNRLGIIDWGIGGTSILKLIKQRLGDIPVTYFSDTGVTPYGRMSRKELPARLDTVISYLKDSGVTHLVIGCNAASTAIPRLSDHGIEILGMIDSAVETAVKQRPDRLGLIGGRQTVMSGAYRRAFAGYGMAVHQRIAQPLSGMIESGDVESPELFARCVRILSPLRNCSHILLACTHYPAILPLLQKAAPGVCFIDPAPALVDRVSKWDLPRDSKDLYLTTGDADRMRAAARSAFGWNIDAVTKLEF
jgi:glutamate racemase